MSISSVAVIGAGPSGLAAAKYLLAENAFSRVRVLEQRPSTGGAWTYTETSSHESLAVPRTEPGAYEVEDGPAAPLTTPVYDELESNIPASLMRFSDKPFPEGTPLFPPHEMVKDYLEDYANDVRPHISLFTQVVDVRKPDDGTGEWAVTTRDIRDPRGRTITESYDAVIVASGHYSEPYVPDIPGLVGWQRAYPGTITHAKFYRSPHRFARQKVVVVGYGSSGADIAAQLAGPGGNCRRVLVSEKDDKMEKIEQDAIDLDLANLDAVPLIRAVSVLNRTVHFVDGSVETGIDALVFCTGYLYSFPFLRSLQPSLVTDGTCVHHLYEHVLWIPDPSLAFVGIPQRIVPFPVIEAQSAWVARMFSGRLLPPAPNVMAAWEDAWIRQNAQDAARAAQNGSRRPNKTLHTLDAPLDIDYINRLASWSAMAPTRPYIAENDGAGKLPPSWGPEQIWVRRQFPRIKQAFRRQGPDRTSITTLEELGFVYTKSSL